MDIDRAAYTRVKIKDYGSLKHWGRTNFALLHLTISGTKNNYPKDTVFYRIKRQRREHYWSGPFGYREEQWDLYALDDKGKRTEEKRGEIVLLHLIRQANYLTGQVQHIGTEPPAVKHVIIDGIELCRDGNILE